MKTYQYHYVYITTNLVNNKKYVGLHKTNNLFDGYLGSGRVFLRAKKKYGFNNFFKVILEFCENEIELKEREIYWIKYYDVYLNKNSYNVTKGGESNTGRVTSDKMRKQISEGLKKYYKENPWVLEEMAEKRRGKKMTKESLEKQLKTRELKGSNCIKIIMFEKDGKNKIFNSIKEAGEVYGQTLLNYMKKDYTFFHNKLFIKYDYYKNSMDEETAINLIRNYKKRSHVSPIEVLFLETNSSKKYITIADFCEEVSCRVSCVGRAIKNGGSYRNKYIIKKLKQNNNGI